MIHQLTYGEFITACDSLEDTANISKSPWSGNVDLDEARAMSRSGNEPNAAKILKFLETLDETIELPDSRKYAWRPSVAGAYACVSEAITGYPLNMRNRVKVLADTAPIRIFITTIIPSWASAEQLVTRFSAIVALTMYLQRYRAVELHTVCSCDRGPSKDPADILDVIIPSTPISLSHAGFVCHPAFNRWLQYNYCENHFKTPAYIPIARGVDEYIMKQLGVSSEDLFFPLVDRQDIIVTAPDEWVKVMAQRFIAGEVASFGWSENDRYAETYKRGKD